MPDPYSELIDQLVEVGTADAEVATERNPEWSVTVEDDDGTPVALVATHDDGTVARFSPNYLQDELDAALAEVER